MNIYTTTIKKCITIDIHTEGTKDRNKDAAAVVIVKNDIFSVRLPDEVTIFTSEARAIDLKLWNIPYNEVSPRTILKSILLKSNVKLI